jgi:hypothetical protein
VTVPATAVRIAGIAITVGMAGMAGIAGIAGCSSSGTSSSTSLSSSSLSSSSLPSTRPPGASASAPVSPASSSGRFWIMGHKVFDEMISNAAARRALAGNTVYVLKGSAASRAAGQAAGIHVVETADFTSEATLAAMLPRLPAGTGAVLYDNEHWPLTPPDEQADPVRYYQKAEALVHAAGYVFIATPGATVVPSVAAYADVVDVQAQEVQATPSEYSGKVLPVVKEIRRANPKVIIVSGLSTNPRRGIPTAAQLVADAKSVASYVQGYWLNVPAPGPACPRCGQPHPQIGIRFLQLLGPAR